MKTLSELLIPRPEGNAVIKLLHGDLTALPPDFSVDILAISAFPGDYSPIDGTLIGALSKAGLSITSLARNKGVDLLPQLRCWLSNPLTEAQQARFNVKKILCFEPTGSAQDVATEVDNLFRGINTFAIDAHHNEIAMPVLSTGNRRFPMDAMLSALLDTAIFWLENGLPLTSLFFVLHTADQVQQAMPIFETVRQQYALKKLAETKQMPVSRALQDIDVLTQAAPADFALPKLTFALQEMNKAEQDENRSTLESTRDFDINELFTPESGPTHYDYFISYSHKHTDAVQAFVTALQTQKPGLSIFYDRDSIPSGGLWIKMISDAIQNSKNVICILTPEYSTSSVCWDEFQCAYIMEQRKKSMLRTINFYNDENLPPIMAIRSYIDCTEGDLEKLKGAVGQLLKN